jgi:hypothetical protein
MSFACRRDLAGIKPKSIIFDPKCQAVLIMVDLYANRFGLWLLDDVRRCLLGKSAEILVATGSS